MISVSLENIGALAFFSVLSRLGVERLKLHGNISMQP